MWEEDKAQFEGYENGWNASIELADGFFRAKVIWKFQNSVNTFNVLNREGFYSDQYRVLGLTEYYDSLKVGIGWKRLGKKGRIHT